MLSILASLKYIPLMFDAVGQGVFDIYKFMKQKYYKES